MVLDSAIRNLERSVGDIMRKTKRSEDTIVQDIVQQRKVVDSLRSVFEQFRSQEAHCVLHYLQKKDARESAAACQQHWVPAIEAQALDRLDRLRRRSSVDDRLLRGSLRDSHIRYSASSAVESTDRSFASRSTGATLRMTYEERLDASVQKWKAANEYKPPTDLGVHSSALGSSVSSIASRRPHSASRQRSSNQFTSQEFSKSKPQSARWGSTSTTISSSPQRRASGSRAYDAALLALRDDLNPLSPSQPKRLHFHIHAHPQHQQQQTQSDISFQRNRNGEREKRSSRMNVHHLDVQLDDFLAETGLGSTLDRDDLALSEEKNSGNYLDVLPSRESNFPLSSLGHAVDVTNFGSERGAPNSPVSHSKSTELKDDWWVQLMRKKALAEKRGFDGALS